MDLHCPFSSLYGWRVIPLYPRVTSGSWATVGVASFKKSGNVHDIAASKATDHNVVGDKTENNSANPQTLLVENQHINPPEEPELMANAGYDAIKKVC
ncbi:hypothetical protein TNCV_3481001 [Trichonephila clavipes]|nr:hypothetical protein TNCV_3481001 [Trichonephila clavipes]